MKDRFYISSWGWFFTFIFHFISIIVAPWWVTSLFFLFCAGVISRYYKTSGVHQQGQFAPSSWISPIDGRVCSREQVTKEGKTWTKLVCKTRLFSRVEVHLPFAGTFEAIEKEQRQFFPLGVKRYYLCKIKTSANEIYFIRLRQFFSFQSPNLFAREKDQGRLGGVMGLLAWGGKIAIYLPDNYQVLVEKGQILLGAETPIALAKD